MKHRWTEWNKRRRNALEKGEEFNEPPPTLHWHWPRYGRRTPEKEEESNKPPQSE